MATLHPAMSSTPPEASAPLKSVFTTEAATTVGFGTTKRKVEQTVYVFVEEQPDGMMACRALNGNFVPSGKPRLVSREELLRRFTPAPNVYLERVLPALRGLERAVDEADRLRESGQGFTAEFEYKNALRIDENHVRASFGLGLTYLERGDTDKAVLVFRKISRLEGAFTPEFKHLFNEFGIQLRKNGMLIQAVGHYAKALRLTRTDEHLHYNLARTLYDKGKLRAARRILKKALLLRPDFPEARAFLKSLGRHDAKESAP